MRRIVWFVSCASATLAGAILVTPSDAKEGLGIELGLGDESSAQAVQGLTKGLPNAASSAAVPRGTHGASSSAVSYLVDNRELQSQHAGVAYRLSKKVSDVDTGISYAEYGSTISGVDEGDGWVKAETPVGTRYLPQVVEGHRVLVPQEAGVAQAAGGNTTSAKYEPFSRIVSAAQVAALQEILSEVYDKLVKRPLLPIALLVALLCSAVAMLYRRQPIFADLKAHDAGLPPSQAKPVRYERKDSNRVRQLAAQFSQQKSSTL